MKRNIFCAIAAVVVFTNLYSSDWSGNRVWIGPEYWANPLPDWKMDGNVVSGMAARDRTLHHLTRQVVRTDGDLELSVKVRFEDSGIANKAFVGGYRFGVRGMLDGYRHALMHATESIDAGIRADGKLVLGNKESTKAMDSGKWIQLTLSAKLKNGKADVDLSAKEENGRKSTSVKLSLPADQLLGNLSLLADGPNTRLNRSDCAYWNFRDWSIKGSVIDVHPEQSFGPILWSQYTLSRNTVKLLVMMAPVEDSNEKVRLQLKKGRKWVDAGSSTVDSLSRTALFRFDDWDETKEVAYRVLYNWEGVEHVWPGMIRPDPKDQDVVTLGAFSCDNGYIFPNTRIVDNVTVQDPDILFFAGDQIYESFGGFGINRSPVDVAMLDYLRKYWMFGWSWRELLRNRPSIIIPDDHDVFQGNLWGHGGRRIPGMGDKLSGQDWPKGGYGMDPSWINAVERTQTASLPDPVDPRPAGQGIGVYFTDMVYGGLDLAILEDRKFKTGPKDPTGDEPQLLGSRQEAFLGSWADEDVADFKVVLSQTIFCDVASHAGQSLKPTKNASDSNGWPKDKRDKALSLLKGRNVVMIHGDQHLGALVHQGVDDWEDSAVAFMVPGSANGFPRAWWPDKQGENRQPGEPEWTGRYLDDVGNRMTVLAAANPEKGSNLISKKEMDPESIGHHKGSGHGILRFNRKSGAVTFEMWRLQFDANHPQPGDQFIGFPKTLKIKN